MSNSHIFPYQFSPSYPNSSFSPTSLTDYKNPPPFPPTSLLLLPIHTDNYLAHLILTPKSTLASLLSCPSRYWPRLQVPEPGGCHGGWEFHSQGCSVHSSHKQPWGLPLSAAAGCHPGRKEGKKKKGQHISGSHNRFYTLEIELGSIFPTGKCFYVSQISLNKKQDVNNKTAVINTIG